jgi:hypothetical protein
MVMSMTKNKIAVRRWTWQWLIIIAVFGLVFSCGAWVDRQSYDIDEDIYNPNKPWKQMIWEASVAVANTGGDETRGKGQDGGIALSGATPIPTPPPLCPI